jgi:hypothetical protein
MPSRTLSVSIARDPDAVYAFIATPPNFPQWAPSFARSVRPNGAAWVVETPEGPMDLAFVPLNPFRVADHSVTVRPGLTILNPIRVLANGDGAEVLFTLFQTPNMTLEQFATDAAMVESDLQALKRLLEAETAPV